MKNPSVSYHMKSQKTVKWKSKGFMQEQNKYGSMYMYILPIRLFKKKAVLIK